MAATNTILKSLVYSIQDLSSKPYLNSITFNKVFQLLQEVQTYHITKGGSYDQYEKYVFEGWNNWKNGQTWDKVSH